MICSYNLKRIAILSNINLVLAIVLSFFYYTIENNYVFASYLLLHVISCVFGVLALVLDFLLFGGFITNTDWWKLQTKYTRELKTIRQEKKFERRRKSFYEKYGFTMVKYSDVDELEERISILEKELFKMLGEKERK